MECVKNATNFLFFVIFGEYLVLLNFFADKKYDFLTKTKLKFKDGSSCRSLCLLLFLEFLTFFLNLKQLFLKQVFYVISDLKKKK